MYCVLKQNIWEVLKKAAYEGSNAKMDWAWESRIKFVFIFYFVKNNGTNEW